MKKIKISYIIPAYNARNTIKKCIKQIKKQKFDKEIIVINDGSNDDTEEICKNEKIFCVTTKNYGAAHARNIGLDLAKGEYITLIDSDVYLRPNWAEKVMKNNFSKYDFIITPCINNKKEKISLSKKFKDNKLITYNNLLVLGMGQFLIKKTKNM